MRFFTKDNEIEITFRARRSWTDFHIVRPYGAGLRGTALRGLVWGRFSLFISPLCELCHNDGVLPDGDGCPECCDHEYDSSEGFMCINCNSEYPW